MRFYRLVFNRDDKVTFVTMGLNKKKKFKMAPNLTQIKIPKSESSSPAQCPQDYLCQIWCNCDERKYAQKCEKWHFFLNTENVVDAKFKDRNRDTNCSTLSVFAIGRSWPIQQKKDLWPITYRYWDTCFWSLYILYRLIYLLFTMFLLLRPWCDLNLESKGQGHEPSSRPIQQKKDHWPITYR